MNITVKLAKAAANNIDRLNVLTEDFLFYSPMVDTELVAMNTIRQGNPAEYSLRCLLFALASPMNRFDSNVIAAERLHKGLYEFETIDDVYKALAAGRNGTIASGNTAKAIYNSLDYLRGWSVFGPPEGYVSQILRDSAKKRDLFGAGPKVTAMAAHLWNSFDYVYTLDTHMLRGIMKYTLDLEGTFEIGETAYLILENAMIQWAINMFPMFSLFNTQWTLWSVFRGDFTSHLGIFKGV